MNYEGLVYDGTVKNIGIRYFGTEEDVGLVANYGNKIIKNADLVKEINDYYFANCYQARNEWMVDRSNLVIAVFTGQKSGTKNTIDYANKKAFVL